MSNYEINYEKTLSKIPKLEQALHEIKRQKLKAFLEELETNREILLAGIITLPRKVKR